MRGRENSFLSLGTRKMKPTPAVGADVALVSDFVVEHNPPRHTLAVEATMQPSSLCRRRHAPESTKATTIEKKKTITMDFKAIFGSIQK